MMIGVRDAHFPMNICRAFVADATFSALIFAYRLDAISLYSRLLLLDTK